MSSEIHDRVKKNIALNREASAKSRFNKKGLSTESAKMSSKNFYKLMKQRGLNDKQIAEAKDSFKDSKGMKTRHAKQGEKFVVTHGDQSASGVYVSKKSLGSTPEKRINKGALPPSNKATYETKVELAKDQNIVYGKIAPQQKFKDADPGHARRKGGGQQVITDGGYKSGAIRNKDPKYPVPVSKTDSNFKSSLEKGKTQSAGKTTGKGNFQKSVDKTKSQSAPKAKSASKSKSQHR